MLYRSYIRGFGRCLPHPVVPGNLCLFSLYRPVSPRLSFHQGPFALPRSIGRSCFLGRRALRNGIETRRYPLSCHLPEVGTECRSFPDILKPGPTAPLTTAG